MLEARTFVDNLNKAKEILKSQNANLKGKYASQNIIYASKDPSKTLADVFLRLRHHSLNIWEEKDVIVAIKETKLKRIGKDSIIPLKKEFDTEEDAREFIDKNYSGQFKYSFEYGCIGWQYNLGGDQVDLEDIEGHLSIEFKSKTVEGLERLLKLFGIKEVIKGPTVIAVKEMLNR